MHFKIQYFDWENIILDDRELSHGAKAMAMFLGTYMNKQRDFAYPGYSTIAGRLSITRKTAIKHINELVKAGYLDKQKHFGTSNKYSINLPSGVIDTLAKKLSTGSVNISQGGVKNDPPLVENLHPNIQKNIQKNPPSAIFLPKDDNLLTDFAFQHGLSKARSGESFWEYRNRLKNELELKKQR